MRGRKQEEELEEEVKRRKKKGKIAKTGKKLEGKTKSRMKGRGGKGLGTES